LASAVDAATLTIEPLAAAALASAVDTATLTIQPPATAIPRILTRQDVILRRLLRMLPAIIALTVISSLLWGPVVVPLPFAIFVLSFQAYWLWRALMTGTHAVKGFFLLRRHTKIDWYQSYERERAENKDCLDWQRIRHIVVIPNYTESIDKLHLCLDSLTRSEVASQVFAVLAMEEREGEEGRRKAALLQQEYEGRLGGIFATFHPAGLPREVPGKASNETWAAREARLRVVEREGHDLDHVTITSCDVDTVFHPKYFSCLTYKFATGAQRYRRFWQGPIFYYNNIWQVPAPLRLPHALAGLTHLARLSRSRLRMVFPQSTYSLSLRMADEVGYWDPDVIPEDWHMFLKCFFRLRGEVDVETMYIPLHMDGARSRSYWGTFFNYYQQARRHAWGCSDIPYAAEQVVRHPEIPIFRRLSRFWGLTESHILWSTQWFMVTMGRVVPQFVASHLGVDSFPDWFVFVSHWTLTPTLATLLILIFLDTIMRPRRPRDFRLWYWPIQYAQWFLMAGITFFSSALPALDAQIRLALGRGMDYKVMEKA